MPPIPLGNIGFDAQIQAAVNRKLEELKAMEKGAPTGRLLEFEGLEEEQGQKVLEQGLIEIANYVGLHFLIGTPPQALEQLVIAASNKRQSPAILIKPVLNNFLAAYITPGTSDKAENAFDGLCGLRNEVEVIRRGLMASSAGV